MNRYKTVGYISQRTKKSNMQTTVGRGVLSPTNIGTQQTLGKTEDISMQIFSAVFDLDFMQSVVGERTPRPTEVINV